MTTKTTTVATTEDDFTDADRAEWTALMDQVSTLSAQVKESEQEAGSWLRWGLKGDAESMALAVEKAKEYAARAEVLWHERCELHDRATALPYGAHVRARVDALRAEREEQAR